jgi:SAM-dependent methyltransferase
MGFVDQINVDFSLPCIEQMRARNSHRNGMKFRHMDVCELSFADNTFDVIFDKAVFDTLMCDGDVAEASKQRCANMISEMYRVLRPGGHYIIVSLNVDDNLTTVLAGEIDDDLQMPVGENSGVGLGSRYNWICSSMYIDNVLKNDGSGNSNGSKNYASSEQKTSCYQIAVCKKL